MIGIVPIILLVVYFLIEYFVAGWFYEVVEAKGYRDRKYFWICFWLGIVGYLLVIALPNRSEVAANKSAGTEEDKTTSCPHCEKNIMIPKGTIDAFCPWCGGKIK